MPTGQTGRIEEMDTEPNRGTSQGKGGGAGRGSGLWGSVQCSVFCVPCFVFRRFCTIGPHSLTMDGVDSQCVARDELVGWLGDVWG